MMQALIGPITSLVGGYFERKAEEMKAVHEAFFSSALRSK